MTVQFLTVGQDAVPGLASVTSVPLSVANAGALYRRRQEAIRAATGEYVCFIDGSEDKLLPGFVEAMETLAADGKDIGYAAELVRGQSVSKPTFTLEGMLRDHSLIHHGVVCRREALLTIDWPEGCYAWEVIAYGTLAQRGFSYDPTPRYDWWPSTNGARLWPSYARGVVNSKLWLQGRAGVHFKRDMQ